MMGSRFIVFLLWLFIELKEAKKIEADDGHQPLFFMENAAALVPASLPVTRAEVIL